VAEVALDGVRVGVAVEHGAAVGNRDRIGVDVEHASARCHPLRDLVDVAERRYAGADVEELPDAVGR
jgi:hypothetical protein